MSSAAQRVCIEALSLPGKLRAELAECLLASLEEKSDPKADNAWKSVVRRRRAEVRSGKAKVRRTEDVMRDALDAIS